MMDKLGRAVASQLYRSRTENQSSDLDFLWEVIADHERVTCYRIAGAVLDALREPTQNMMSAADAAIGDVIQELEPDTAVMRQPDSSVRRMFAAMIKAAGERERASN